MTSPVGGRILRTLTATAACAAAVSFTSIAYAQSFPVKPVRIVNPAAPGGNSDVFFRLLQPKMTEALGQPVVMDYRPGAGGTVGGEVIARSAPDGYTTGIVAASFVINPAMIRKMPYDTVKDFTDLGIIVDVPSGLVVHPSLPVRNVKELIALAKSRPEQIFYSTSGRGTVGHLAAELLDSAAGIKLVHVPYKGAGPAAIALVSGNVQMQFASIPLLVGYVKSGRLRMIAQTGAKRAASAQDVPTMIESGLPGFVVSSPFGFIGPAHIPKPVADRLNQALVAAIRDPEIHKSLVANGAEPVGSTPEEHAASVRSDVEKWKKVAKGAGIEPQ
jgi:tripartite-type tricarboxylate transporter receptor subunit TctC